MKKTSRFLEKTAAQLFGDSSQKEQFITALESASYSQRALLWCKPKPADQPFRILPRADFQGDFVDWIEDQERPGAHPLHDQGYYYCLDLSSVFAASALNAIAQKPQKILDLCASPGGKSIYAWKLFSPAQMVCNEAIGKRLPALISNLKRLEIAPATVTNYDPGVLASRLGPCFDLVICDVPCSGQSLLVKGRASPGCFHPSTINMNANRQRRIVANALNLVSAGGYLAYMTCTFSHKENEELIEWALKKFPDIKSVEVSQLARYRSHLSSQYCYRLWPFELQGAGAFVTILRKADDSASAEIDLAQIGVCWKQESGKQSA